MSNDIDVFLFAVRFLSRAAIFYGPSTETLVFVDGKAKNECLSIKRRLFVDGNQKKETNEQENCNPGYQGLFP